jgi:hypothetical protein
MSRQTVTINAASNSRSYIEPATAATWLGTFLPPVPTFHGLDARTGRTRCGVLLWTDTWGRPGCLVPLRHAIRFGRPCARCWP